MFRIDPVKLIPRNKNTAGPFAIAEGVIGEILRFQQRGAASGAEYFELTRDPKKVAPLSNEETHPRQFEPKAKAVGCFGW